MIFPCGLFLDDFVYDAVIRPVVEIEDVDSGRQVGKSIVQLPSVKSCDAHSFRPS